MNEFVNVAVVVCRTISPQKNDFMLKDIFDLHDASNRRLKKIVSRPIRSVILK